MKTETKIIFITMGVLIFLSFFLGKSCIKDNGIPVALYEKEIKEAGVEIKALTDSIREKERAIVEMEAEKNGAIDSANTVIARKEKDLLDRDEEITKLEHEARDLTGWEDKYNNEKAQKSEWIKKFNLVTDSLAEARTIIFQLNKKYEKRVELDLGIIADWEEKYNKAVALKELAFDLADEYRRALNKKKWEARVTQIVALGLGGYVIYNGVTSGSK